MLCVDCVLFGWDEGVCWISVCCGVESMFVMKYDVDCVDFVCYWIFDFGVMFLNYGLFGVCLVLVFEC